MLNLLNQTQLVASLSIVDLSDPLQAPGHAMGQLVTAAAEALKQRWHCPLHILRASPVVPLSSNYDRLNYPSDGAARAARYTRYVTEHYILRTQTSSAIPDYLAGMAGKSRADQLIVIPGLVYRRDSIDRLHCAEPHQLDLWRVIDNQAAGAASLDDLHQMIATLMDTLIPHTEWRITPSPHPYTTDGVQIDAHWQGDWIEVGECGLIHPSILAQAGLLHHNGLAMGLGLDRLLMIRKDIPDIRLLRSRDPRVLAQMHDLQPYRAVSVMPAITRDLSLVVDMEMDEEQIGDRIRCAYPRQSSIESLTVVQQTAYDQLPEPAKARLAIRPEQKNLLLRLVIRDMDQTLTAEDANRIRNEIYQLLHQGAVAELAMDKEPT